MTKQSPKSSPTQPSRTRQLDQKQQEAATKIIPFSWVEYLIIFVGLGLLATLPAIFYGGIDSIVQSLYYLPWYALYWVVVSGVVCSIIAYIRYRTLEKPMRQMGTAAKKVAEGDFSVHLGAAHTINKRNYIDVMFEDFNKMVAQLSSTETLKSDFVANVSHEFKTPLAVIQNYASCLQDDRLSPALRQEYAKTIVTYSERLSSLVSNILKLSKIENQVIVQQATPFDLSRQLSESLLSFEHLLEEKQLQMDLQIEDRTPIVADEELLKIVWDNLFSNAVKFTPPHGDITVTQSVGIDCVTVTIADTGCGMDEETQRHMFDQFYQGDTSHASAGNGLGLALVARIVALLGATIAVQSQPNQGAAFTVVLPKRFGVVFP